MIDLIEFFIHLWNDLYVFYWKQSFFGLFVLVSIGLLILCLMSIWVRGLCAKKLPYLQANLAFKGISKFFYYGLFKILSNRIVSLVIALLLVTLWNFSFWNFGENFFVYPDSSSYSILLTKFSGIGTKDRFGELGTREFIAREFNLSADSATSSVIDLSFSNQTCVNGLEAEQLRIGRSFDMLTWGFVEAGADSLTISIGFCWKKKLSIIPVHRQSDTTTIGMRSNMSFTVPVTHTVRSEKLHNWVRKISLYGLVIVAMDKELWESAVKYLDLISSEFPEFDGDDELANTLIKLHCLNQIRIIDNTDNTRLEELLKAAVKCDSISQSQESFPQSLLSVIKWYAGKALVGLGDISKAESYFRQAIEADSTNVSALADLAKLLQLKPIRYDESLEIARMGLKVAPGNIPLLEVASLNCVVLKLWSEALTYLGPLYMIQTDNEKKVFFLIYANLMSSNVQLAEKLYLSNLAKWPCMKILELDFADEYFELGDTTKARNSLSELAAMPHSEVAECVASFGLGVSQFEEKRLLLTRKLQNNDVGDL